MTSTTELAERGWVPDLAVRWGMRRLLRQRLALLRRNPESLPERFAAWQRAAPIVEATREANAQHYEVPSDFFATVLGPNLKYSCGYWPRPNVTLGESEAAMLELTCQRAGIADGMRVLELGCGWGSLSLWMAARFPRCAITAMSNSATQRSHVERQCRLRGITNLTVQTANVAEYEPQGAFDRVVSVEMFEHVRNWAILLGRVRQWLDPSGELFLHVFCHRTGAYPFEVESQAASEAVNWMSQHFFTGGIMPSFDQFLQFPEHFRVAERWWVEGTHYARTSRAWLQQLDTHREAALAALAEGSNPASLRVQVQRWRMFFMACEELFAMRGGAEWGVGHYRLVPAGNSA